MQQGIPRVNLAHFRALNDGIGIIQHAPYSKPDLTWGYTTDDVARALVFVCRAGDIMEEPEQRTLLRKYVAFLDKMRTSDGRWSNEMRRDGSVADAPSGRDHPGRRHGLPAAMRTLNFGGNERGDGEFLTRASSGL